MRNLIIASALSLSLAACATAPVGTPTTGGAGNIVSQVQAATTAACAFLPTAQTVLNLVSTFTDVSALGPVATIAQAICNAVASPSGTKARGTPRVRGVAIKGRFVR